MANLPWSWRCIPSHRHVLTFQFNWTCFHAIDLNLQLFNPALKGLLAGQGCRVDWGAAVFEPIWKLFASKQAKVRLMRIVNLSKVSFSIDLPGCSGEICIRVT